MNPDNVLEELERAQRALRAAQILHANDLFEDAVSRSYYAVMYATPAAGRLTRRSCLGLGDRP